jgi:hypothetical protein
VITLGIRYDRAPMTGGKPGGESIDRGSGETLTGAMVATAGIKPLLTFSTRIDVD